MNFCDVTSITTNYCTVYKVINEMTTADGGASTWREKWAGFLTAMNLGSGGKTDEQLGSTRFVFSMMLRLYAHKPVVHELRALYEYSPDLFLFYVPQLVNFALYGGADQVAQASLEEFLKEKCAESLRFAQRVWWFIAAYSPDNGEGLISLNAEDVGERACAKLPPLLAPRNVPGVDTEMLTIVKPLPRLAKGPPHVIGLSSFRWTLSFATELSNMGVLLKEIPLPQRVSILRATLRQLETDYMPSRYLYLPVGRVATRIVGIVDKESFCFKTNERVPFLVCLELVDRMGDDASKDSAIGRMRSRSSSTSAAMLGEDKTLGQWTPRQTLEGPGRGAGFSHFGMHPDAQVEMEREHAKRLALAQFKSSADMTEVELEENAKKPLGHALLNGKNNNEELCDVEDFVNARMAPIVEQNDDDDNVDEEKNKVIFSESWASKEMRIAQTSKWSHLPGWRLMPVIVKSGDDLRQEQFASQLISLFDMIWKEEKVDLWLHPYEVIAISPDSGIIECVPDTISLDSLKKNDPSYTNLKNFYIRYFGRTNTDSFIKARDNFAKSLAAYCIVCYILQIKDRHNGNILLDAEGHIVHIDFGFILGSLGPGRMNFEADVPFKLTSEFIQVLGGPESAMFRSFRTMCCNGYLAVRKRREQFQLMIEMMANKSSMPCFQSGADSTIRMLNERFCVDKSRAGCIRFVNDLIDTSINHWRQRYYDVYQWCCVGISV